MNQKLIGRILVGLLSLLLFYSASTYLLNLDSAASAAGITPNDLWGRANIRANMGGPMLFVGIVYAFGAIAQRVQFVHVGIFYFISVIIGRVISILQDGFSQPNLRGIIFATVMLVINLIAFTLMSRGEKAASA
ncbi:MAG: DUF4345 family protein [Chloroflexota bacterium]